MLKSNILNYIKMRKEKTMAEIEKNECISEADVYILEIGYQLYIKGKSLDIALSEIIHNKI